METDISKTLRDSIDLEEADKVNMNVTNKILSRNAENHLTSDLLEVGSEEKTLREYYDENSSEGSLEEFLFQINSGDLPFKYIENVDLPQTNEIIQPFDLKWNLKSENHLHKRLFGDLAGVTKPTFYFGTKYSAFPWHKEDGDVRSLSFLVAGSDKVSQLKSNIKQF